MFDKDAIDFLPDALAIRYSRLPWWARHTLLWMGLFFIIAIIWASLSDVDVIVTAHGRLVSDHPTIVMKPLERTVIKGIHVLEGDRVRAGQVLITFDPVFSGADQERLSADVRNYEAQLNRLTAEFDNKTYTIPAQPTEEERIQLSIFLKRDAYYRERLEFFDREIERITKARRSYGDNLAVQQERLKALKDIEDMLTRAHGQQAASLRELRDGQLSRMALEADISDKQNNILVLDSELKAKEAERDAFRTEWRISIAEQLVNVQTSLTTAGKELEKASQLTSYVALRAPEDAVVHDIAPFSIGSAVQEAETLITLVPLNGTLEVEAEIDAAYIGKVKIGDKARVKLSSFPFQQYGTLLGEVRVISEDAFSRQPNEAAQGQAGAFYRARITLTGEERKELKLLDRMMLGMETQSEIYVEKRKIMEYILNPIIKSLDESLHEP